MNTTAAILGTTNMSERVVSGMRPTGALHLGHYHGALKNWARLQTLHPCFFFVADWHALTTHYESPGEIGHNVWEMVIDWLAGGIDPEQATLFLQSRVPEHAELHVLLSMGTPLGWLERVPTYKDQQEKLADRDLATYGFLGYPLLQAADILIYRAAWVPVGEDQVPHIELTREIARRFNHLYGHAPDPKEQAAARKRGITLENAPILSEPQALLTEASRLPGVDGQKMSKSYGNAIAMRESPESVTKKIRTMPTDPARVRRTDPGDPERCPVWALHGVYSTESTQVWVQQGCRSAGIGCIECKQPVIDAIISETSVFIERSRPYQEDPRLLRDIVDAGCDRARLIARETMREVRDAMGLGYV
jgi:tryptophanyl-tRNA synthetase